MQALFTRALLLAWSLWLGGLVGVLLAVTTIFAALDPDKHAAGAIAAQVFANADKLVFILAAFALLSCAGLLLQSPTKSRQTVFALLILAALLATGSATVISPKINAMRKAATTESPEFKKLHGLSMLLALTELLSLTAAGLALPPALTPKPPAPIVPLGTIPA